MGNARRGRPSREDYTQLVVSLIRADVWALDQCETFAPYPGVRTLVARNHRLCLSLGVAIKLLLDRAVADVIASTSVKPEWASNRVAEFLRLWYSEGQSLTDVANTLHLERHNVMRTVQRPALTLVAQRFLELAGQVDPLSE